jgi:Leishmanolysin
LLLFGSLPLSFFRARDLVSVPILAERSGLFLSCVCRATSDPSPPSMRWGAVARLGPLVLLALLVGPVPGFGKVGKVGKLVHEDEEAPFHDCIHDSIHPHIEVATATQNYEELTSKRGQTRQVRGNIRLVVDTDELTDGADQGYTCYPADLSANGAVQTSSGPVTCTSDLTLTAGKRRHLQALLTAAETKIEEILEVNQISGPLSVPAYVTTCYPDPANTPLAVPAKYKDGSTTNTDMVMLVTTRPILSASTLAFASDCVTDQNGRPIMGFVNFSPTRLRDLSAGEDPTDDWDWGKELGTAIHEIAHALGFSGGKLSKFRNQYGNASRPVDEVVSEQSIDGKNVKMVISENVLAAARAQFNCPLLGGAEFEDGGSSGTAGTCSSFFPSSC